MIGAGTSSKAPGSASKVPLGAFWCAGTFGGLQACSGGLEWLVEKAVETVEKCAACLLRLLWLSFGHKIVLFRNRNFGGLQFRR